MATLLLRASSVSSISLFCLISFTFNICTQAQLPAVCTNPSNFYEQTCCPEPFVGAGPCGSLLVVPRGRCIVINNINQSTTDIRGNWPHYYGKICKCEPQFGNFDCGECASGFSGTSCNKRAVRTRKLINHLTEVELDDFVRTLYMAKSFPSRYVVIVNETQPGTVPLMKVSSLYDVFVWIHYYISKETYTYDFGHGGPGFPIWHRQYLMWFERELQWMLGNGSNFAFPFWDWSSPDHRMYPFQEHILGASNTNGTLIGNFANWTTVCYDSISTGQLCDPSKSKQNMSRFGSPEVYAANYTKWPRREEICKAMDISVYDSLPYDASVEASKSFRNFMEGFYIGNETCDSVLFECMTETGRLQLHNQVHNMLKGTITDVPTASNDPLFILHHAFVDYILEMWIRRYHGDFKPPPGSQSAAKGHNYNDLIVPFLPLVQANEMLVESTELGWTYESLDGLDIDTSSCESWESEALIASNGSESFRQNRLRDMDLKQAMSMKLRPLYALVKTLFTLTLEPKFSSDQLMSNYHICMLTSEELVFQIPPNCDKLLFQNNLILPDVLTPFSWYSCSAKLEQPQTRHKQLINKQNTFAYSKELYICTKVF